MVENLKDMLSVVKFLEDNTIESDKLISEGMSIKELAEAAYDEILSISRSTTDLHDTLQPLKLSTRERIGSLLSSKDLNPASFFSFSFKLGVYLPILSPFLVPLAMTMVLVVRRKLYLKFCKKKEEEKMKTE